MNLQWTLKAWEEYVEWQEKDKKTLKKINKLIKEALRTPCEGTGHPEPLKYELSGQWSREIDPKNRLVYWLDENEKVLLITSCKGHYLDK